jgi:hypothetical protein
MEGANETAEGLHQWSKDYLDVDGHPDINENEQADIIGPSILKGATLAVDAVFLYIVIHSELSPAERTKLIWSITAAHWVLVLAGTTIPSLGENSEYKKAIILCCSALTLVYAASEQFKPEKEEKESSNLKETIAQNNIFRLTFSAGILAVSYDALYSSFGKYGSMSDRGLNMDSILVSNLIITLTIFTIMWCAKELLEQWEEGYGKMLKEHIRISMWKIEDIPHIQKIRSILPQDEKQWESFVMNTVMTLILSFGVRGVMGAVWYKGMEFIPTGTTFEALGISTGIMMILNQSQAGQVIAKWSNDLIIWVNKLARKIIS